MNRALTVVAGMVVLWAGMAGAEPRRGDGPDGSGPGRGQRPPHRRGPESGQMAGHGHMLERIVQSPEIVKQLGLEADQVKSIREALFDIKVQEVELRAKLEKAGLNQARLLMQDDLDEAALMESVERTGKVRTELAKLRMRPLLVIRKTLSPEQLTKARGILGREMMKRRQGRKDGDRPQGAGVGEQRERRRAEMKEGNRKLRAQKKKASASPKQKPVPSDVKEE